jgi:AraC family transcriptional regulator, arabinose operon regulatory protein
MERDVLERTCARNASISISAGGGRLICGFDADPHEPPRKQLPYCPQFSFSYVFAGSGRLTGESGKVFEVQPGSLVLRFPNRRQDLVFGKQVRYAKAYVCIDPVITDAFLRFRIVDPTRPVLQLAEDDGILERWRRLWNTYEQATHESFIDAFVETQRLLALLLRWGHEQLRGTEGVTWLSRACRLLASRLDERLPMADVAREVGVDYHTFRRTFASHMGMAPGEYRIHRRIDKACSLLATRNISETGYRLGYATPYAFSAQFKKYVGQSPREYRKTLGS